MADVQISGLTTGGAVSDGDVIPVEQGGGPWLTFKITALMLYAYVLSKLEAALRLMPAGGNPGEVLQKATSTDYDVTWSSAGTVPAGSVAGYVLTQRSGTAGDYGFEPSAAGSPGAIQHNNGTGGLAGAANAGIGASGSLELAVDTAPTVPAAGLLTVFARALASRNLPAFVGPSGLDSAVQPFLGRNKVGWWTAPGNASVAPTGTGLANATATGTNGTRNVATTNVLTSLRRAYNVSAATAGASGGWRLAVAQFYRSTNPWGGLFFATRIGEDNAVTDSRCFIGFHTATTAIGNVNPSTLLNIIGVGFDSGESVWSVMHNDGSGTATKVSLGASFPCNTSAEAYDVIIFAPPGQTTVWVQMIRLSTGDTATTEITSADLPALNTLLAIHVWCNNGPTASAKGINLSTLYIETDI